MSYTGMDRIKKDHWDCIMKEPDKLVLQQLLYRGTAPRVPTLEDAYRLYMSLPTSIVCLILVWGLYNPEVRQDILFFIESSQFKIKESTSDS